LRVELTRANWAYAVRLRGEIINAIERGTFRYGDYFPDSRRAAIFGHAVSKKTMGELLDAHIEKCRAAAKAGNMSRGTVRVYDGDAEILKTDFGKVRAVDFTAGHIKAHIARQSCTAKTIRNRLSLLRVVCDEAIEDGVLTSTPFAGLAAKRAIKKVAKKSDWEVDPFSPEERAAFLDACPSDEDRDMYTFWFHTGLRPSELIMFEWDKVDGVHRKARIDTAQAEREEKGPKTEAGVRDVELDDHAWAALERQRARTFLAGGRVWRNTKTLEPFVDDRQLRRASFKHIMRKAKVRYRAPYQIRHTYASWHCSRGRNPWWLAKQMGHETVEMLFRHYGRGIEIARQAAADGHAVATQKVVPIRKA
jgi:integrase